ncbi:MAG: MraY family glycosyltransferase [Nitrospirota bacterium]
MPSYIIFFSAFAISFLVVPVVISFANNRGLVAIPGRRHIHTHPTPKFGGIAIASGVLLVSPFIFSFDRVIGSYLAASSLMLVLGIIDDVRIASWKVKLAFSIAATSIIIFGADVWVSNLGNLFGFGDVYLGMWGIPFTFIVVFGVINAINLIDGLNGLACGVSSIAFLSFAIFASNSGNETVFFISIANLGATLGLFRYNYPRARIFMGDSGSMFLGFSLAVLAILLTQGQGTINPMIPVMILGIPIFDTLRVFIIRLINRKSPFRPDKTHLHHLMMRSSIPPQRVVNVIWTFSALMSVLAFVLYRVEAWVLLVVYCIFAAFLGLFVENLNIIKVNKSRKKQ